MIISKIFQRFPQNRPSINLFLKKIDFGGVTTEDFMPNIRKNWLTVQVTVKYLHLDDLVANAIQTDAFNSLQFVYLDELVIQSRIQYFFDGAFKGLNHLKRLTLRHIQVYSSFHALTFVPLKTLEWFTMENCFEPVQQLSVDSLFAINHPHLMQIKIMECNLGRTITDKTFTGLANINELMLTCDQIEQIGPKSFDVALERLKCLNLTGNRLKTLPDNIFYEPQGFAISIVLDDNPWHCDCLMENLRKFIQNSNDDDLKGVTCETPIEWHGQSIFDLPSLCIETPSLSVQTEFLSAESPNLSPLTTNIITPTEIKLATVTAANNLNNFTFIQCGAINVKKNVKLSKPKMNQFPSIRMNDGKLLLYTARIAQEFFYFAYDQSDKTISKCLGNSEGNKVRKMKIDLQPHRMYRLCRVIRRHNLITPLECIPFFTEHDDTNLNAWVMIEHKAIFIWVLTLIVALMPFIGISIAILMAKIFPKSIRGRRGRSKQALSPIPTPNSRTISSTMLTHSEKRIRFRFVYEGIILLLFFGASNRTHASSYEFRFFFIRSEFL